MGEEMIIELPWPPKELSPNGRLHWAKKRQYTTNYKGEGWAYTLAAMYPKHAVDFDWPEQIEMTITFYPPDKRRRDDDNIIGSFKAGRDGVAIALNVDDSRFRPTYKFGQVVKGGKVTVEI